MRYGRVARERFPLRQRHAVERLACQPPARVERALTHWSQRSLAQAAGELELVDQIGHATVGRILAEADLQPHRFQYWKTTVWNDEAIARALRILWHYERVESLWLRGEVLLCIDEKPNLQVLERAASGQPMRPGQVERQEFEYVRHGTVNLLAGLTVHNGRMGAVCLDKNDGEHFRPALQRLLHPYSWAKRIHVVLDNGSSHISADTRAFFRVLAPRVQVLMTPSHASWLNQAEPLLEGFSARYLTRGSWPSRPAMIHHILKSRCDYNAHFAHRFNWTFTRRDFLFWLNSTAGVNSLQD